MGCTKTICGRRCRKLARDNAVQERLGVIKTSLEMYLRDDDCEIGRRVHEVTVDRFHSQLAAALVASNSNANKSHAKSDFQSMIEHQSFERFILFTMMSQLHSFRFKFDKWAAENTIGVNRESVSTAIDSYRAGNAVDDVYSDVMLILIGRCYEKAIAELMICEKDASDLLAFHHASIAFDLIYVAIDYHSNSPPDIVSEDLLGPEYTNKFEDD